VTGWQTTASLCFYAVFATTAAIRESFGVSRALVGLTATAALLGYTAGLFPAGAVVDRLGERPAMVGGLVGLSGAVALVAVAPTFPTLLVALAGVGLAYAAAMPATNRAVLAVAPTGHRNLAMNVKQVGVTAGSGTSALVVTYAVARTGGYAGGFLAAGAFAVVVAVAFARLYRGDDDAAATDDPRGDADDADEGFTLPDPRAVLASGGVRALVAAGVFFGAAVFSTTAYVVLHVTEAAAGTAAFAGVVLAGVQATGSLGRLGGGAVADRLPLPVARATGLVLVVQAVLAAGAFVAASTTTSPATAAVAFTSLGFFILGFPGTYYACLTALVPDERVGSATAAGQTTLNVGGLLAPPAFGLLADAAGYGVGWLALGVCSLLAAGLVVPIATGRATGATPGPADGPDAGGADGPATEAEAEPPAED
jgi:MFS family permease